MKKKVIVRKIKKLPVILTILLFVLVFIVLFLLYREVNIKNDSKDKIKSYIETVNEYLKESIYNYEGEYYVYKNTLFSKENKDSFTIDIKEDFPSISSTLIIKEHTVVSGTIYIGKYKGVYSNNKITVKRRKSKKSKRETIEDMISIVNKNNSLSWVDYKIIEEYLNETKDTSLESKLNSLKGQISYSIGEVIQYNPIENKTCENGDKCYSFSIIGKNEDAGTLNLILNNDLENSNTSWYSLDNDNSKGYGTALEKLNELTEDWNNSVRLITYEEAISIGCSNEKGSCPVWLYQNLNETKGFWTSSSRSNVTSAWYISNNGAIRSYTVNSDKFTVRPVIEIESNKLN